MLTVFYSPHATSTDNEAKRASGHADVPLSEIGIEQAHERGQHYESASFEAVFTSDLQRASVTAQIAFGARGVPIILDARLRECDYGTLTQHPVTEIDEEFPRRIVQPFPGGESVQMVVKRVGEFLWDVLRDYDGKAVVVIGHRATRYALEYWSGDRSLEEIVNTPWEWRDVPIWRYDIDLLKLEHRALDSACVRGCELRLP